MTDKFEKFTERARKVFALAQDEAQRLHHNYIGTEHLLLGLVKEGDGIAARALANLGVQLPKVRSAVEFIIGRGDGQIVGDTVLTPRTKKVIELAMDEAQRFNLNYIGTEHLLLGLVREGEGIAAGVLASLHVSLEKVRQQVMQVLSHDSAVAGAGAEGSACATDDRVSGDGSPPIVAPLLPSDGCTPTRIRRPSGTHPLQFGVNGLRSRGRWHEDGRCCGTARCASCRSTAHASPGAGD